MEQLKAFAIRANLEREECLEKERALARERVDETLKAAPPARGVCPEGHGANPSLFYPQASNPDSEETKVDLLVLSSDWRPGRRKEQETETAMAHRASEASRAMHCVYVAGSSLLKSISMYVLGVAYTSRIPPLPLPCCRLAGPPHRQDCRRRMPMPTSMPMQMATGRGRRAFGGGH